MEYKNKKVKIEGDWLSSTVYGVKYDNKVIYIGVTTRGLKSRIQGHFKNANSAAGRLSRTCPKFYEFIRENNDLSRYSVIVLGQYTLEEGQKKEREFIEKYNTRITGCNVAPGGNNPVGNEHYLYGKPISRKIIEASIKARKGKPLSEEHKKKQREGHAANKANSKSIKAVKCDQTGEQWISLTECAKHFGVSPGAIKHRIKYQNERKARNGSKLANYTFSYLDEQTEKKIHKPNKRKIKIQCIETEKIYNSQLEACNEMGLCAGNLSAHLAGRRQKAGGYTFRRV